ncbi:MAG: hypothetical protein AB1449_05410 [Chloroflexota bacterium]
MVIRFWQWDLPLPPWLGFLAGPPGSALVTLAFWLVIAAPFQSVVLRGANVLARRFVQEGIDPTNRRHEIALLAGDGRGARLPLGVREFPDCSIAGG